MIIGISGKKHSGKSTVGMFLVEHLEWVEIVNFADPLKDIIISVFGATHQQVYGTEVDKQTMLPNGMTARRTMQSVGKFARLLWPEAWIHAWRREVERRMAKLGDITVVCCDVRYPNEVAAIHAMGGIVIRLTRCSHIDVHESETALDGVQAGMGGSGVYFDKVIDNRSMGIDETNADVLRVVRANTAV